ANLDEYMQNIANINESLSEGRRQRVVMGVAVYNQGASATVEKIRVARLYGFNAICIFSYDAHKTNLAHFKPIIEIIAE
ncbi:MAG: hypothetical protein JSW54_02470, partial [Fidelibacterota bacterium]